MKPLRLRGHAIPEWLVATILVSLIGTTVLAYDLWPSFNTTLEVKEPLSIVDYWAFVAATHDATTGSVKLYVNGTAVNTTTSTLRAPNPNPSWNMHIGVTGGPLYQYFQGSIDEVQIYNRALTQAEISSLYRS